MTTRLPISEVRARLASAQGAALRRLVLELQNDPRTSVAAACEAALRREETRLAERLRVRRLYQLERKLHAQGFALVAGVDEVGRGAIAGPLSAGACILPSAAHIEGLNDSKRLSPERRREVARAIRDVAVCWSVAHVPANEVDALGVAAALRRAMGRALAGLSLEPDHVVVDGLPLGLVAEETAVVKGDSKVAAVAAASVLAKVERDSLMCQLAPRYPAYSFEVNKGYGTVEHLASVAEFGCSDMHRRSFLPGGGTDALF